MSPGFDAGKAVDPLDYDFTTAGFAGKGRIPDPTDGEIEEFRLRLAGIFEVDPDNLTREAVAQATDRLQQELQSASAAERRAAIEDLEAELLDTISTLCKGTPSVAELRGLGRRYFSAFLGWLFGELLPKEEEPRTPSRPVQVVRAADGS